MRKISADTCVYKDSEMEIFHLLFCFIQTLPEKKKRGKKLPANIQ